MLGRVTSSETLLTTSITKRVLAALVAALAIVGATRVALLDWRPTPTDKAAVTVVSGRRTPGQPKRLLVYVGSMGRGVERAMPVLRQLMSEPQLAGADLLTFDALASNFTSGPAQAWATRLRAEIDAQWIRAGGYDDVILSGASLGSLLVRQAFLESRTRPALSPQCRVVRSSQPNRTPCRNRPWHRPGCTARSLADHCAGRPFLAIPAAEPRI